MESSVHSVMTDFYGVPETFSESSTVCHSTTEDFAVIATPITSNSVAGADLSDCRGMKEKKIKVNSHVKSSIYDM